MHIARGQSVLLEQLGGSLRIPVAKILDREFHEIEAP